ncbi:hypothetical protein [Bacillus cereus]|uniref:hypothetical protein n=1 Tax=Bacillus cereus TaxID=1396 RepID=UPI001124801B|nr:hypothetical protein [Bacillus cereus]QDD87161.1 hypothetical protein FORC087_375 [Bacillus cereus]
MKKFLCSISTLCMILGLVTGCSSKDDTGISVTRNVAEKDQQKGSETKRNKEKQSKIRKKRIVMRQQRLYL